ncbi:hypothetical protein MN116_005351 [Schistosoma mekongi]|uniref:Cadherin domain-containing protein n=1 Tax=Schistosoma mekongi TaxID=38744 RepID=A0AAE1ZE03_SCHME|nr:hypothetical protein MN116_005351 [Schistosoma mekongi]
MPKQQIILLFHILIFLFIHIKPIKMLLTAQFTIFEELPINTTIGNLITKLPVTFQTNVQHLRFRIITSEYSKYFYVNVTTGQIQINQRLDYENICPKTSLFHTSSNSHTDTTKSVDSLCQITLNVNILRVMNSSVDIVEVIHLIILIQDIDDNICEFLPTNKQEVYVIENLLNQTNMIKIPLYQLIDLDTGYGNGIDRSSIKLKLDQNSNVSLSEIFDLLIVNTSSKVSPYSLYLLIKQSLDYESIQKYKMTILASNSKLNVSVHPNEDVINNDYTENSNTIKHNECFLNIIVHVIDMNDHPPTFLEKNVHLSILENIQMNTPIYTPKVSDLDAGPIHKQLIFELSSRNSPYIFTHFNINSRNGSIFLKQTLNYKERQKLKILITVRNPRIEEFTTSNDNNNNTVTNNLNHEVFDKSHYYKSVIRNTDSSIIDNLLHDTMELFIQVIDVNDHKPVISVYTPNGSHVLTIQEHLITSMFPVDFALVSVTDDDSGRNGQVKCELGRNSSTLFKLTLIGYESSNEKLVTDDYDNKRLSDLLSNDLIIYKMSALVSFDREENAIIYATIRCTDLGSNPLITEYVAQIHITDINDNEPRFPRPNEHINIMEDSDPLRKEINYYVMQATAIDADIGRNAKINYYILEESVKNLIKINESNGIIQTTGELDREVNNSISFTVIAKDSGEVSKSNSVSIHITVQDYNDEYPEFNKKMYEYSIQENSIQGYYIDTIMVIDKDIDMNSQLTFYLAYEEDENINNANNDYSYYSNYHELRFSSLKTMLPFKITSKRSSNQHNYELNLFINGKIDREELIRINQRRLKSTDYEYMNAENTINYNNNDNSMNNKYNDLSRYRLMLTAEDFGIPKRITTALIYIQIIDVNDEAPIFINPVQEDMIYTISINEVPGYQILKFKVNDPDEGINSEVRYTLTESMETNLEIGNGTSSTCKNLNLKSVMHQNQSCNLLNYLYLNHTTGSLFLLKQLPNHLSNATCRLQVIATDMGISPLYSTRYFCLHLMDTTDSLQMKWLSSQINNKNSLNYMYIIIGTISVALILSTILLCIACTVWKYPKLKLKRNVIKETSNNNQASRIHCVTEKLTNKEKYNTIICTENEWVNMNSNNSTTNQTLYFDRNDYNQYFIENRYPRNSLQELFFELLPNSTTTDINYNSNNSLSKRLYNEQNIYLNPDHNLTYSTLPQH